MVHAVKLQAIDFTVPEAEEYIHSIAKERMVSKGDVLIQEGQSVNKTFFVLSGSLRSFCIDKEGKEHTLQFAIKDWWISDFIAMYNHVPASLSVECISDSMVLEFDAQTLNQIFTSVPRIRAVSEEEFRTACCRIAQEDLKSTAIDSTRTVPTVSCAIP